MAIRPLTPWLSFALLCCAGPAAAQSASTLSLDTEVGVVSDYRFRGYSLSDHDPALQAGVTASLAGGIYGSVWGSTIDEVGTGAGGKGATVELDYVIGWAGAVGGFDLDVSAQAYNYPGGHDVSFVELPASVSRRFGDWRGTLGVAYAPSQQALGHTDNTYGWVGADLEREGAPVALHLTVGYEDGAFAPGGKWDWSAGLTHPIGPVSLGLSYVDSDRSGGALIGSLTARF